MTGDLLQQTYLSTRACHSWQQQRWICRTREIAPLVEEILAALPVSGFSEQDRFAIRLSLEEALVNAIKHGHKYDPKKRVDVRYSVESDRLLILVADQGPGYNPELVPNPLLLENLERSSGRGLLLMQTFMTWVRVNDKGNCVTMCKESSGR